MNISWEKVKKSVLNQEKNTRKAYIPFRDSDGNLLDETEILFTDEKSYLGKQQVDIWDEKEEKLDELTVASPGVTYIYDDAGNFPIALRTEEGKLAYLKVSKRTGEILPIHAGCCSVIRTTLTGATLSGKTVSILQISDSAFHDMLARKTRCSFQDDLPSESPGRRRYEAARRDFKINHKLPEATKKNETILPYVYYVQNEEGNEKKRILLILEDIDGESCTEIAWDSKVFNSNQFILMIGADEIMATDDARDASYVKVTNQILSRLPVLKPANDYQFMVIITKCDYLPKDDVNLRDAFNNSLTLSETGRWTQTFHETGFDYDAFNFRSECLKRFIQDKCPNFYNKIRHVIPEINVTYCMMASVGETCVNNHYEKLQPFCIDEPILSILSQQGLYPIAIGDKRPLEEEVKSYTGIKPGFFHKWRDAFLRYLKLDYEEDFEYEFKDE